MADGFDVLEAMDGLKSAGFSDAQSRALADSLQQVMAARQGDLVTKSDLRATEALLRSEIAELRTELKGDIAELRTGLKSDIEAVRAELTKMMNEQQRWTLGFMVVLFGLLYAGLKLT